MPPTPTPTESRPETRASSASRDLLVEGVSYVTGQKPEELAAFAEEFHPRIAKAAAESRREGGNRGALTEVIQDIQTRGSRFGLRAQQSDDKALATVYRLAAARA